MEIWQNRKLLIIDDEPSMCRLVASIFEKQGATVTSTFTGEGGLRSVREERPDLILLDILLPGMDGLEVCRRIREFSDVPIVILTAVGRDSQLVRCLYAGADDYVTKPFKPDVLKARSWAVLRRADAWPEFEAESAYEDGHLLLDMDSNKITAGGKQVQLTTTEYQVLAYLYLNSGRMCDVSEILQHLWGDGFGGSHEEVRIYIWHLRQQLEPNPKDPIYIVGNHEVGFTFQSKD
ncbi:MAG: response regulator transcription factor [Chloroflexota bacterium]